MILFIGCNFIAITYHITTIIFINQVWMRKDQVFLALDNGDQALYLKSYVSNLKLHEPRQLSGQFSFNILISALSYSKTYTCSSLWYVFKKCQQISNNSKSSALQKLESPLPKDTLSQVSLKLAQWFWRSYKSKMWKVYWQRGTDEETPDKSD